MKYLLLLFPFLLISCKKDSDTINQDEIYQSYEMSYDESTNVTTFKARFTLKKEDGKKLKLTGGSIVTVNGETMVFSGISYTKSFTGYLESGTVVFTDADGKTYTNILYYEDYVQNDPAAQINNSTNCYWQFIGAEVSYGETLFVKIVSNEEGTASATTKEVGAYYIDISSAQMELLPAGSATATTIRSSTISTGNWTSVGGKKNRNMLQHLQMFLSIDSSSFIPDSNKIP